MKLPPNFAREWVFGGGSRRSGRPVKGWKIRIGDRMAFVPCQAAPYPGAVRKRLEAFLNVNHKRIYTTEETVTMKSRMSSAHRRSLKNALATGKLRPMVLRPGRTLAAIKGEEQLLAICLKFSAMGEYKK